MKQLKPSRQRLSPIERRLKEDGTGIAVEQPLITGTHEICDSEAIPGTFRPENLALVVRESRRETHECRRIRGGIANRDGPIDRTIIRACEVVQVSNLRLCRSNRLGSDVVQQRVWFDVESDRLCGRFLRGKRRNVRAMFEINQEPQGRPLTLSYKVSLTDRR